MEVGADEHVDLIVAFSITIVRKQHSQIHGLRVTHGSTRFRSCLLHNSALQLPDSRTSETLGQARHRTERTAW
jgi:hypothetical protein